jgi:hypothetical protein
MLDDVRRLVDADGLDGVPVLATSARTGEGVDALREEIQRRVKAKKVTRSRIEADIRDAADRLQEASGTSAHPQLSKDRIAALEDAFADAAGVPTVVAAVEAATRMRAGRATGWPVTSWLSRLRPDPLKRLHLDLGDVGKEFTRRGRTSVPAATQVQRARVDSEVRAVADDVSAPLARPWADAVRRASVSRLPDLNDRLDSALSDTELHADRIPVWAGLVRVLQWALLLATLAGVGWLAVLAGNRYVSDSTPSTPEVAGFLLPTVLFVGGAVLGVLLGLVCRVLVSVTARSRARAADHRLRAAISKVADELVVVPVRGELTAYDTVRDGLARALK